VNQITISVPGTRVEDPDEDSVIMQTSEPELNSDYLKSFSKPKSKTTPRKQTGKTSEFFHSSQSSESKRISAGTSTIPAPPLDAKRFGLIQEELADKPFDLLIAVKLLNKTRGHFADREHPQSALNTFSRIMDAYPNPEALATADLNELTAMIEHLGLQNQRAKILIQMAQTWMEFPPERGVRYRTLGYPAHVKHAGKDIDPREDFIRDENKDPRIGAFEVAHLPGVGTYALDSWRIFCRDRLRGLADSYNGEAYGGKGILNEESEFEPEWKRVRPQDKELRAFLKWMWLKEGWVWDPDTGEKHKVSKAELEKSKKDDMFS